MGQLVALDYSQVWVSGGIGHVERNLAEHYFALGHHIYSGQTLLSFARRRRQDGTAIMRAHIIDDPNPAQPSHATSTPCAALAAAAAKTPPPQLLGVPPRAATPTDPPHAFAAQEQLIQEARAALMDDPATRILRDFSLEPRSHTVMRGAYHQEPTVSRPAAGRAMREVAFPQLVKGTDGRSTVHMVAPLTLEPDPQPRDALRRRHGLDVVTPQKGPSRVGSMTWEVKGRRDAGDRKVWGGRRLR